jgi:hypothetical protein
LALTEKVLGKEHPDTLTSINNLAVCDPIIFRAASKRGSGRGKAYV